MNRNRKLIASLVGIVALTNTVMPVCAKPSDTLVHANVTSINEGKKEKEQGNINLLDPSVGLVSNSNNMNNNGFPYLIQPNDTLSSIAKANNTTVEKLMETTVSPPHTRPAFCRPPSPGRGLYVKRGKQHESSQIRRLLHGGRGPVPEDPGHSAG